MSNKRRETAPFVEGNKLWLAHRCLEPKIFEQVIADFAYRTHS
jgi:hypothetical protein